MLSQILYFSTMGRNGLILIYLHLRVINAFVSVRLIKGLGLGCLTPQYFSYIMSVSFIGGGNQSTR
jgi:hypothetical protein